MLVFMYGKVSGKLLHTFPHFYCTTNNWEPASTTSLHLPALSNSELLVVKCPVSKGTLTVHRYKKSYLEMGGILCNITKKLLMLKTDPLSDQYI